MALADGLPGGRPPAGDAARLAVVPLFQALRSVHLAALAAAATTRQAKAGEQIATAGRPGPGLVVLKSGKARRSGLDLGPGAFFDEMAALDVRMAEETVTAIEPVEYLALPARAVHEAIRADPELAIALIREVGRGAGGSGSGDDDDLSEQLMKYAADVRESFREGERRQDALRQSVLGAIRGLVDLAEAKHPWSRGHASRAARTARALAIHLGLSEDAIGHASLGGLLHDVGFVVVESAVLRKAGPLAEDERRQVQAHPVVGARIIEHIDFLRPVVPFVLHHHERYDGHGYPNGLAGKAIPLGGRLMAAVELYETLRGSVPDLATLSRTLRAQSDAQLDREVANALADLLELGKV